MSLTLFGCAVEIMIVEERYNVTSADRLNHSFTWLFGVKLMIRSGSNSR